MRKRKDTWVELGIVGLGVLLLCGGPARAQGGLVDVDPNANPTTNADPRTNAGQRAGEPPTQPPLEANPGAAPGQASGRASTAETAQLRQEVARLRAELAELRAQVAELRAQRPGAGQQGVGGGGRAGVQPPGVQPPEEVQGTSVATAFYSGTLLEVGPQALVIADEEGSPLTLDIDRNTQVLRDGRRIGLGQLRPGMRVRASVDLLADGRNEAVEVVVQPLAREAPARRPSP